jgi:hypothetical protein
MQIALVFAVIVLVAVVSALLARRVQHPEQTATHDPAPHEDPGADSTSDRFYTDSRPAGPDAEDPVGT